MRYVISFLVSLLFVVTSCTTTKTKTIDAKENASDTPLLTRPEVRKVWVPQKIEGNKFIEGHWMYVIERQSAWNQ